MITVIEEDIKEEINKIKNEIKTTNIKIMQQVNSKLIMMYFRIGKILEENSKYGNSFIKNVSHSIKIAYPNIKGFSDRNLKYMKRFYNEYKDNEKVQQLVAHLPWGDNVLLFEKIKDMGIRLKYIEGCIQNGWSRSVLLFQIETKYYERIGNSANNFKNTFMKHYLDTYFAKEMEPSERLADREVIKKINEEFGTKFTERDKVIFTDIFNSMVKNDKLKTSARSNGQQMFSNNIMPKSFDDTLQKSYFENMEAYESWLKDKEKYEFMRKMMAEALYKAFLKD